MTTVTSALADGPTPSGSVTAAALVDVFHIVAERVVAVLGVRQRLLAAGALLEQGQALSQHLRLVGEAGHSDREVEQEDKDERERNEEECVRRIGDADRVAD